MPVRSAHYVEDLLEEGKGNLFVEQITHRVHEDELWLPPAQWSFQDFRMKRELKAVGVLLHSHVLQTLGKSLRVAELAARTDLGTASRRVPGRVTPFYGGGSHWLVKLGFGSFGVGMLPSPCLQRYYASFFQQKDQLRSYSDLQAF